MMKVIDGHCDVLFKMLAKPSLNLYSEQALDVTLPRMRKVNMLMQAFAIFLSDEISYPNVNHIQQSIELFQNKVLHEPAMIFVRSRADLQTALHKHFVGALLTLEGVDALAGSVEGVQMLFDQGVRCMGITWNYGNWAADGVLEPRQGGLTLKGKELIRQCNLTGMIIDVSHLAETGFWELCELTSMPFIASHSNAYACCQHPRNLKDEQIQAMISIGGLIGLTFVPYFIRSNGQAKLSDLLHHLDHICSLGGKRQLGFGSDFDGIDQWVDGLEHTGQFISLYETLQKHYAEQDVEAFMWKNSYDFYMKTLPDE